MNAAEATPRPHVLPVAPGDEPAAVEEMVETAVAVQGWYDDVHGDPGWRRHMTLRFATEIVEELRR